MNALKASKAANPRQRKGLASNPFFGIRFNPASNSFHVHATGKCWSTLLAATLDRDQHFRRKDDAYRARREQSALEKLLDGAGIRFTITEH